MDILIYPGSDQGGVQMQLMPHYGLASARIFPGFYTDVTLPGDRDRIRQRQRAFWNSLLLADRLCSQTCA